MNAHRSRIFGAFGVTALLLGGFLLAVVSPAARADVLAEFGITSCSTSTPCIEGTNSGTGAGVEGLSAKGRGVIGNTSFRSTTSSNGQAGVYGQDASTSGSFDVGVQGTSKKGVGVLGSSTSNAGVAGTSSKSTGVIGRSGGASGLATGVAGVLGDTVGGVGVEGTSVNGNGVVAKSIGQSALFAENTGGADGIQSIALANDGTNSSTQNNSSINPGRSGVWGHDDSTDGGQRNVGVAGSSINGIGISASSSNFVGLNVVGGGYNSAVTNAFGALSVVESGSSSSPILMAACANPADNPCGFFSGSEVLSLDTSGNLIISGVIKTSGSCSTGCIAGGNGASHRVTSYAPSQTIPSMDDFGEAQLVNGEAYVRLSADFANVVDQHATYLVFITPEGDNKGLYVTQKTHAGFVVKESQAGRSTIAFSYRIVAKPYGVKEARLPATSIPLSVHPARTIH